MKQYIGTKIVEAEPAMRVEGKEIRPMDWVIAANDKSVEVGYRVRYADGYESWSPKDVFQDAYRPTESMNFGLAIEAAKKGYKIARLGWNGKGQYVELAKNISYVGPGGKVVNTYHQAIGNCALAFVGTSGVQVGWLASQADMLADDWMIVGENGEDEPEHEENA